MKKPRNIFLAAGKIMAAILLVISSIDAMAANGVIDTRTYKICPGDTIVVDTRQTIVYRDTVLYDTILVQDPTQDSIYVYVVNTYPPFLNYQERTIERGTFFDWYGKTISHAGEYEQVFKSTVSGCDSIYRIAVRERIVTSFMETLCAGNTISFGGQTIGKSGIYRDTIHFYDYDSIIVMTINVVKPDTTITVSRIPEGTTTTWNGETYSEAGVYDSNYTNRFGCDSLSRLVLTTYHVDTIDTIVTLCPSETLTWYGMTYGQSGTYNYPGVRENGDRVFCRLDLTVLPLQETERTFTLCDDESVTFNGKTYVNVGTYYDYLTCDTLCKIVVVKYPTQLHVQNGTLDATNLYYWRYTLDGEEKTDTLTAAGVYEYTTHNTETGCNDIWRLVLTKDETSYHYLEEYRICESESFSWRGKTNLNRNGIGQTTHYYDNYLTAAGNDSIYELILTVNPVLRTARTIPFCGTITYNGVIYTESVVLVDTLTSVLYNCDSIVITTLSKGIPFHQHDTATIYPGEILEWRGRTISQDGQYEDKYASQAGCDSIYSIGVGLKEVTPSTKTKTYLASICADEYYEWRGQMYYNSGTYVDTTFVGATEVVDSLYILVLNVYPKYTTRERVTFHSFPASYRGYLFTTAGEEHTFTYTSMHGCDSTITVVAERELNRTEEWEVICPSETFIWSWDGRVYSETGTYVQTVTDVAGVDSVEHILHLTVRYIPDTYITKTICSGSSYTFGSQTLTEAGDYTFTFSQSGCDSTVHLSLNVVSADTAIAVHHMDAGQHYVWNGTTYYDEGVFYKYYTNRYGCDSVAILQLTVNHVDTIDTTLTICPDELPVIWHGIRANQSGDFTAVEQQVSGDYIYYRMHLTVREVVQVDTTFTICQDASVSFNGRTYTAAGHYRDYLTCDTLMNVHVVVHPQQVYETKASLGGEHGYTWTYWDGGVQKTAAFTTAGTYEYESVNETTGCSELWRLILTKDETSYHFVETLTICEGDEFSWRGFTNLSHQGIGETSHYYRNYETRTGKDSIYELVLTVMPVERTVRTITFCGSVEWNGVLYTTSAVVYDTISLSTGCYRIERINLDKALPFYSYETKDLPQGQVLYWHGRAIVTDGIYRDEYTTIHGCDSVYELAVTIVPATAQTNQYAEELSTCEGDTILWRGMSIWREGTYVDTVWSAGHEEADSIFTLHFTAWPAPKDTIYQHLYTCGAGAAIRYQGKDYYTDTIIVNTLPTIHGCDSTVKVYLHFNTALFLTDTVKIADIELPYTWHYRLGGLTTDTVLTAAGTYNHLEQTAGGCYNQEQILLIVYPTYLYEQDTTICELDLPFYWLNGPIEHTGDALQHAIGETKQYEYRYQSVNNTDSIYRLHLTIDPAPTRTQSYFLCAGESVTLENGKTYFNLESDKVYRDTITKPNAGTICDSIIYIEIYQYPIKEQVKTVVLQVGESIEWNGRTISSGGTYRDTIENIGFGGCDSVSILRVVQEQREERTICKIDTAADTHPDKKYPYLWTQNNELYTTSGIWTDTVYDADGFILEYHTLYLTITQPYDTTIYVHGCINQGALWRDYLYWNDTTFVDRVEVNPYNPANPCDSVFHVHIVLDTVYQTYIDTTICETQLPFILGRQNPQYLWEEHVDPITINDVTACGCDSTITLTLRITPSLRKNDSTFVCEDYFHDGGMVYLGDTVHPWFDNFYHGQWEGKWHGVGYNTDTIVWDCDSTYFHHIIVRPRQAQPVEETYILCAGDSVQLFWPFSEQWISSPGVYRDTIPTASPFLDSKHGYTHSDRDYLCDSIIQWTVLFADTLHEDTTVYIAMGDSILWNNRYYYVSGAYDSIGYAQDTNSLGEYCKYVKTLHLIVDSTYYFRDTLEICELPGKELLYSWDDGFTRTYTLPTQDTALHVINRLKTMVHRFDSIYDLYIDYRVRYVTQLFDTICEGTALRFDAHHTDNTLTQRYLTTKGVYYDTIPATNGCDSVIILYLTTRDSIPTQVSAKTITDREIPYLWSHTWYQEGRDTTYVDTLRATGQYSYTMPSIYGCDSTVVLNFLVHQTHIFRDTVEVCALANTTLTHLWNTGYRQAYTVPAGDADIHYYDTLDTRVQLDSVYDLYVHYNQVTVTYLDANLCYGDSLQFGLTKSHQPRFLSKTGVYRDTLVRLANGCDSIIELRLNVYPRYFNAYTHHIANTEIPYIWEHTQGGVVIGRDTLRAEGEYIYHYVNAYGCDSVDSLSLRVHATYLFRDTVTICQSETPYAWETFLDIYETGEYIKYLQTHDGYDSTHVRYVQVFPVPHDTITETICEGDSLRFGLTKANQPRFLYSTGMYNDTLTTIRGCDSIITLRLIVYPKHINRYDVHIADLDTPYVWEHTQSGRVISRDTLYAPGRYGYTFESAFGCDSIDSLTLYIHQTYVFRDSVTICQDATPYTWLDYQDIYETGTYYTRLQTYDGYDSTLIRYVKVLPIPHDTIRHAMCEGSDYWFNGVRYNRDGTYTDTLVSTHGCDSIVTLVLKVNKPVYIRIPVDIYEGEEYTFFGERYTSSGTYRHTAQTVAGCDSITELFLTVHPQVDTTVILCANELPYIWVNKWSGAAKTLYAAGLYRDDTTYVDGQRTFYSLQLIVNETVQDTVRASICRGSSYLFHGESLTENGNYHDTLQAANGCDSIVTLILSVHEPYYNYQVIHVLEGQTVEFFGATYTETGTYTHYNHTPAGCDSTSVLQLIVHPMVDTVVTVCVHELPYRWVNKWNGVVTPLYTAGLYRNDTTYVDGEKMYYGLQLIVNMPVDTTVYVSICAGDTYHFNNAQLTQSGEYRDTLVASNGCDSIVILHLNILPLYHHIVTRSIYEGDTVNFQDQVFNTSGRYPFRYLSSTGCDSIIELNLIVNRLFDDSVAICATDLPFEWRGKRIYQSGIYRDSVYDLEGHLAVTGLKVNVLPIARNVEPLTVSICEGDDYRFNGRLLNTEGIYYDTLVASNGCDSIVMLSLQVLPQVYQTEYKQIFEGDSAYFDGQWLKESGVYEHRETNLNNCTSTYQFVLTVLKTFYLDTTAYVCVNELPFVWHGYEYNVTGDYTLPTSWMDSSRVVTTLHLEVRNSYYEERNVRICQGNVFIYNRDTFMTSTIFYDTIPSLNGCDSVIKYIISMHPSFERWDTVHISDKQRYPFNDRELTITGDYESSALTMTGCDSITHLHLVVHPSYYFKDSVELCQPDTCKWHGLFITESGTYYDKQLTAHYGFDSIYELKVVVHPSYFTYEQYLINDGETTILHGINITKTDSIYTDTLHTVYGCDSIFQIAVNSKRTIQIQREVDICSNEYYQFYDRRLTKAGTYSKIVQTPGQMDSLIVIKVNVHPISLTKQRIVLTEEELPYIYADKFYDPAVPTWDAATGQWSPDVVTTMFEDTLYNQYGCDSITRLEFVVTTHYSDWTQIPLCSGEQLIIDQDTIRQAGFYTFVRRSMMTNKLDSLYRVEVYEAPAYEMPPVRATICEGEDTLFAGHRYTKNGTHVVHLTTIDGCDSIVTLELTVNPSYHFHKYVRIWPSEVPYIWEGRGYYNSGDYNMSWQKGNCDSIWSLHLTVVETDTISTAVTRCEGDYYVWYGDTLRQSGTYGHAVVDSVNKISTFYVLSLKLSGPINIVSVHTEPVCANDNEFDIYFSYLGQKPNTYSIYFDENAKSHGFVNVYDEPLTSDSVAHIAIPQMTSPYYVRPDYYKMKLVLDNGTCGQSAQDNIELLVQYPDWVIEQNWDDVVAPLNADYNGGYEFVQTEWFVNNTLQVGTEAGYLHNDNLKEGDVVYMRAMRRGESYYIPSCPIVIGPLQTLTPHPVILSPTYVSRRAPFVSIIAESEGSYELYSTTGELLERGIFREGQTQLTLPYVMGLYILRTITSSAEPIDLPSTAPSATRLSDSTPAIQTQKVVVY